MENAKIAMSNTPKKRVSVGSVVWNIVLLVIILCSLVPVLWGILLSLKTNTEIMLEPFALPETPRWENYVNAFHGVPYGRMLKNTFFVIAIALPTSLVVVTCGAFALGRMQIGRGRMQGFLYKFFLMGIILPGQVMLFPIYMMIVKMGIFDSLWGIIVPNLACGSAMGLMLLSSAFRAIPRELDEAAIVDGCGFTRLLVQVLVPVVSPAIATLTILNFLALWNSFLLARVVLNTEEVRMISQAVMYFKGEYSTDYALTMAGTMILVIPQLAVFVACQKWIVEGVTSGAVKG